MSSIQTEVVESQTRRHKYRVLIHEMLSDSQGRKPLLSVLLSALTLAIQSSGDSELDRSTGFIPGGLEKSSPDC